MNREYKFRAWNKINNTMHQDITDSENWSFSYLNKDIFIWLGWTGLKDKNNIDIYEGDIVSFLGGNWMDDSLTPRIGTVKWNDELLKFDIISDTDAIPDLRKSYDDLNFEIIGNIYQNTELLNTKQ